jgi:endoglucanase
MLRLIASALTAVLMMLCASYLFAHWPWFAWHRYADKFVQSDGRVIEEAGGARTTSRTEAYALFFALVAHDRQRFSRILAWSDSNLAGGRLGLRLPASVWGRRDDGSFGVIDGTSASGADLWFAYDLLEAARLWQRAELGKLGNLLLARIAATEVAGVGERRTPMLLTGSTAHAADAVWQARPSDLAGFQIRYFEKANPSGPWRAVWETYLHMMERGVRDGVVPARLSIDAHGRVMPAAGADHDEADALRVYLWAGFSPDDDRDLFNLLAPAAATHTPHALPAALAGLTKALDGDGNDTLSAALLPFALAVRDTDLAQLLLGQAHNFKRSEMAELPARADEASLQLFGEGWYHHRFRFDEDGRLLPRWDVY